MKPWASLIKPDQIDIVSPEGDLRCSVKGYYDGSGFVIDDMSVDVRPDDEIRRALPNGQEEAFIVRDPKYFAGGPFGSHYQISVSRRGQFQKHSGGNYSISVTGPNSRVNVHSKDSSVNIAGAEQTFEGIRLALEADGLPIEKLIEVETKLAEMSAAKDKSTFAKAYQSLVGTVANHITVVAPFLPTLTDLMRHLQ